MGNVDVLLTRQSIFDGNLNTYAYQLVFKTDELPAITNGGDNTKLLRNAVDLIKSMNLSDYVGKFPAFINLFDHVPPFQLDALNNTQQVILEFMLPSTMPTDFATLLTNLKKQGVLLALLNPTLTSTEQSLLPHVDILKFNIGLHSTEQLINHIKKLKQTQLKLLADQVDNYKQLAVCRENGVDYFQGKFLSQPDLVKGAKAGINNLVLMKLVSELHKPDVDSTKLVEILSQDLRLSYKLLLMLRSAAFSMPRKIESLHEAVVYLGLRPLRQWANLLILSHVDGKPHELLLTTLIRAKMCECLTEQFSDSEPSSGFTVGLFSTLDALLDQNMAEILRTLSFSDEINAALLQHSGTLGTTLACVIAYEQADWTHVNCDRISAHDYRNTYLTSLAWANQCIQSLKSS